MNYVYRVQMQIGHGEKTQPFIVTFETGLPTVEALVERLVENRVVYGHKLNTVDDGRGGRMIRSREPYGLGVAGLVSLQNLDKPVWEPAE